MFFLNSFLKALFSLRCVCSTFVGCLSIHKLFMLIIFRCLKCFSSNNLHSIQIETNRQVLFIFSFSILSFLFSRKKLVFFRSFRLFNDSDETWCSGIKTFIFYRSLKADQRVSWLFLSLMFKGCKCGF